MQIEDHVFRAIAHPARRQILGLLAEHELSVGHVAEHFKMSRPGVAKHLAILNEAGLITVHKNGREVLNRLTPGALKRVADWVAVFSPFWDDKLAKLKAAMEGDDD